MTTYSASTTIHRPAADVWAVIADYERDPDWRTGVETMAPSTSGPAVTGTTTAEVLHLGGRTYRNGGMVTAIDPGRRLEWRTTSGADANGSRSVEPLGPDACTVTMTLDVRFHGSQWVLRPVLGPMLRKGLHRDLSHLASLLERTMAGHR